MTPRMYWQWVRGAYGSVDARCYLLACRGYLLIPALDADHEIVLWCVYVPDRDGTPLFLTTSTSLAGAKRVAQEHRARRNAKGGAA